MAKTIKLVHPIIGSSIQGTITDDEYNFYIEQGYEEVIDEETQA